MLPLQLLYILHGVTRITVIAIPPVGQPSSTLSALYRLSHLSPLPNIILSHPPPSSPPSFLAGGQPPFVRPPVRFSPIQVVLPPLSPPAVVILQLSPAAPPASSLPLHPSPRSNHCVPAAFIYQPSGRVSPSLGYPADALANPVSTASSL